jgi:ATP-dependent DNA helicase DinG
MKKYFTDYIPDIIDGYEERPEQIEMAEAVKLSLENNECLIIEAGTGVGKTLAYLIPMAEYALKNKKRVIISTYSKALQSQIFKKDLPMVEKIFPELKYEIIFGAGNYVCVRRMKEYKNKSSLFVNAADTEDMMHFISDGEGLRENTKFHIPDEVWHKINRQKALCQEEACPHFRKCWYWSIRHKLRKAQIIVVNHHLFFSDLMVNKKLLPESSAVVFDEAHKLEDTMRSMFSREVSIDGFYELLEELEEFLRYKKKETKNDYRECKAEIKAAKHNFEEFIGELQTELSLLTNKTALLTYQSQDIIAFFDIKKGLHGLIRELNDSIQSVDDKGRKKYCEYLLSAVHDQANVLETWLKKNSPSYFYWAEIDRDKNTTLYITPYDLKKDFEEHVRFNYECVVFTSATLSTGENFNYVVKQFGLQDAATGLIKSPFDYKKNALLYLEKELPAPQSPDFKEGLADRVEEIINMAGGGVFVLFTSIDLMKKIHKEMSARISNFPLLIQGQASPMELVSAFKKSPSVLFATSTFWQGIDIKGDALKCVIITRLPFEVPEHPMQKAIYSHVVDEGGNDFAEIALPRAIFMLKQGFGRLIRSKDDYGVVAILDSRITGKTYGKLFIKSLPEAGITSKPGDIDSFFRGRR